MSVDFFAFGLYNMKRDLNLTNKINHYSGEGKMSERVIIMQQPRRLVLGAGCSDQFIEDIVQTGLKKIFLVTTPPVLNVIKPLLESL